MILQTGDWDMRSVGPVLLYEPLECGIWRHCFCRSCGEGKKRFLCGLLYCCASFSSVDIHFFFSMEEHPANGHIKTSGVSSVQAYSLNLVPSIFKKRRLFESTSQDIDSSLWKPSKKSNGMLQSKCRKPADQSVCGKTPPWCGFVATEKTRQINLLHILCLCIWSFELTSQGARPRSSYLFLLLSSHSKQNSHSLVSLCYLTKRTKDLFIAPHCVKNPTIISHDYITKAHLILPVQGSAHLCDCITFGGLIHNEEFLYRLEGTNPRRPGRPRKKLACSRRKMSKGKRYQKQTHKT